MEECKKQHDFLLWTLWKESSYIFSLLNRLTTDTFYGLLSVCIDGVWLYHEYNEHYNDEFYKVKLKWNRNTFHRKIKICI